MEHLVTLEHWDTYVADIIHPFIVSYGKDDSFEGSELRGLLENECLGCFWTV